jgi:hypothetical protein
VLWVEADAIDAYRPTAATLTARSNPMDFFMTSKPSWMVLYLT